MIKCNGQKITANNLAKKLVYSMGEGADYWKDDNYYTKDMTEKQIQEVDRFIAKHQMRVYKFLMG